MTDISEPALEKAQAKAKELVPNAPGQVGTTKVDVTKEADVQAAVEKLDAWGGLDVMSVYRPRLCLVASVYSCAVASTTPESCTATMRVRPSPFMYKRDVEADFDSQTPSTPRRKSGT